MTYFDAEQWFFFSTYTAINTATAKDTEERLLLQKDIAVHGLGELIFAMIVAAVKSEIQYCMHLPWSYISSISLCYEYIFIMITDLFA